MKENAELYYYKLILKRYNKYINEKEQKSITGLKQMINPEDLTVQRKLKSFLPNDVQNTNLSFSELSEDQKLLLAKKILEYLSELKTISIDVIFWPTFAELDIIGAADITDKALFGCSLFLGAQIPCKIYVDTNETYFLVYDIVERRYFYDIENSNEYVGTKLDMLLSKGIKFKYSFNNNEYINH